MISNRLETSKVKPTITSAFCFRQLSGCGWRGTPGAAWQTSWVEEITLGVWGNRSARVCRRDSAAQWENSEDLKKVQLWIIDKHIWVRKVANAKERNTLHGQKHQYLGLIWTGNSSTYKTFYISLMATTKKNLIVHTQKIQILILAIKL